MTKLRIGLREDHVDRGDTGARDEALPAVQHILDALELRRRAHRRAIGARAGLGESVRGEPLTAREPRQESLLLLVRSRQFDPERTELLHRDDQPTRRADLRQLLDHHERQQRALANPAVGLVEHDPEQVVVAKHLDDVPGELAALVDLGRPRRNPFTRDRAHELTNLALLVGQRIERHDRIVVAALRTFAYVERHLLEGA